MTYPEVLKNPKWQKRRLEILTLDAWRCRHCESEDKTLHVHHLYYIKHAHPWDYPNDALITLCETCHEMAPLVNWKQAFLDLNMTEFDLLELALMVKHRKRVHDNDPAYDEFKQKHKCRNLWPLMDIDLFTDDADLKDYYNNVEKHRRYYSNG
jgi:hypothetical protein